MPFAGTCQGAGLQVPMTVLVCFRGLGLSGEGEP